MNAPYGFDKKSRVELNPCITGPAELVNYYCYGAQDTGSICDWITSPSVNCGEPSDDYVIFKTLVIPREAQELEKRYGSFLSINIKANILGMQGCEANARSYSAGAFAGVALVVGLAVRAARKRRPDMEQAYLEMSEQAAVAGAMA